MLRFLRIERPTIDDLAADLRRRRRSPAASGGCSRRTTRPGSGPCRSGMSCRKASPTSRSEPVMPGRSAFVESPSRRSTPSFPSSASRPTSVFRPSTGVWSSFQSPVWTTRPAGVSSTTATQSGIECATRTKSSRNGAELDRSPVRARSRAARSRAQPVLVELRLDEPERELRRRSPRRSPPRGGGTAARRRDPRARA